jgi:hypothetical protein
MNELVSGMPVAQFWDESCVWKEQNWFKFQVVPSDVFAYPRLNITGLWDSRFHC